MNKNRTKPGSRALFESSCNKKFSAVGFYGQKDILIDKSK